jgi:serine/threonine protein phosphatase 1
MTQTRQIIIGDIHGHYQGLMALIDLLELGRDDQIYFLGDLVDRGPESAAVVKFIREKNYPCIMGNHELLMLNAFPKGQAQSSGFMSWLYCGGRETINSYHNLDLMREDLDWMARLPAYLDLGDAWLVHAGLDPNQPLTAQSTDQFCWIRSPFHNSVRPYFTDKTIITGHTITFTFEGIPAGQIAQGAGWLGIDTGAYHPRSGWLTALDWTHKLVYQVNVFRRQTRVRPLTDAVTPVTPEPAISAKKGQH